MSMQTHTAMRAPRRSLASLRLCFVLAALFLALPPAPAQARPTLTLQSRSDSAELPTVNPAFRHPNEPHQLFFLQRTLNANTVVYTARFDAEGKLQTDNPVSVYWRRFADQGQIMALRWYERVFGFGLRINATQDPNIQQVAFNALKSQKLELRQTGPFSAALYTRQNNRDYRLIYAYLDVDESGILPKVTRLRLYTSDPQTGLYVTHTIAVSGGAFKE